jgi:hypothetical protein
LTRIGSALRHVAWLNPNRLRDGAFFPLSLLLAAGLIALAISPGLGRRPTGPVTGDGINYNRILIGGDYLNKVYAGGDALTAVRKGTSGAQELFIEAMAGQLDEAPEFGPHFRLAADIEQQFSGRTVRVSVRARPADDRSAVQIQLNYSAGRAGESGWKVFDLKPGWNEYAFEYKVPVIEGDQGFDFVAVRPVVPEKIRGVVIDQIELTRLN